MPGVLSGYGTTSWWEFCCFGIFICSRVIVGSVFGSDGELACSVLSLFFRRLLYGDVCLCTCVFGYLAQSGAWVSVLLS
jgi:hypothetical protein